MMNRDHILGADDLKLEEVHVAPWGGSCFIRAMTASDRDRVEAAYLKNPRRALQARLAVATVC